MPTRKIIFLDIDGVLNSSDWFDRRGAREKPNTYISDLVHNTDPAAVARLNMITEQTGAIIVLSSSWRHFAPWEQTAEGLRARRGMTGTMIDRTPIDSERNEDVFARFRGRRPRTLEPYPRGYEIQQWLDAQDDDPIIVILDDDADMEHLSDRHVQSDFERGGLQLGHVRRAIELLGRD